MAPGQNTFSIVPNAPGAINSNLDTSECRPSKRPMTTKQAKKAYQKANKGPKLTKAEKRRQELLEQDRIRKEFEKEKNQARAKAARDRKKEKEEKERAERKKKGLPLVDVRPSQDTIAWFVRGNGRKQEKQERQESPAINLSAVNNDDSDCCTLSAENESEPPPKRQRTDSPIPVNPDRDHSPSATGVINGSMSASHGPGADEALPDVDDLVHGHPTPPNLDIDIEDTETIEALPDELFTELINATISPLQRKGFVPNSDVSPPRDQESSKSPKSPSLSIPSGNHSHTPTLKEELMLEQKAEDSASLPSTQRPLQTLSTHEINSRTVRTPKERTPDRGKPAVPDTPTIESPAETASKAQRPVSVIRSFRHPKTPMGPPPVPPKFKSRSYIQTKESRTPPFLLKQTHSQKPYVTSNPNPKPAEGRLLQQSRQECPPTSTQLFMLGHLDDFFPSPSQEVRELFGESTASSGANCSKVTPRTAYPARAPAAGDLPTKSISTVSNVNRSAPALNIDKSKRSSIQTKSSSIQARNSSSRFTANTQSSRTSEVFDMPFFSTQDLVLSSQDMRDLEDDTASSPGSKHEGSSHQTKNIPGKHNSFLPNVTNGDTGVGLSTSIPLSPSREVKDTGSDFKIEWTINNGSLAKSVECLESSTLINRNVASPKRQIEKDSASNPSFRNEARPLEKDENEIPPAVSRNHQNKALHTLQTKKDAALPHGSPKPFFASSGREVHYKYAIERTKTSAWEGASMRQKAREELEYLQRSEDERLERLLLESSKENVNPCVPDICASTSGSTPRGLTPRPHSQAKGPSQRRSINQLSSSAGRSTQNEKVNEPSERRPRQNQSRSSYKEMLELLKQKENQKQEQKPVPASQETDYGDAGLDDVLSEML
ncbi:hypothetical protein F5Y06DRAFT_262428 [Hypoxylon sp. FL0890]|nr:hypothetical protein F5Y06DRAFT_262428 [Hypoxylon sp. FL0890]